MRVGQRADLCGRHRARLGIGPGRVGGIGHAVARPSDAPRPRPRPSPCPRLHAQARRAAPSDKAPSADRQSMKFSPAACCAIVTSPGPGGGTSRRLDPQHLGAAMGLDDDGAGGGHGAASPLRDAGSSHGVRPGSRALCTARADFRVRAARKAPHIRGGPGEEARPRRGKDAVHGRSGCAPLQG